MLVLNDNQGVSKNGSSLSMPRTNIVAIFILIAFLAAGGVATVTSRNPVWLVIGAIFGSIFCLSPRVANQWERGIVLRLGRYVGLRGPGLFWVIPLLDRVSSWIYQRVVTTSFAAEETLTSDTVPVNVDAVLFWMVHDSEKAALEVQDYAQAVSWAAQTGLRDIIGRTSLTDLLRGRERIEAELQLLIDERSNPWGVTVQSVEMRDVVIPTSLQDAMSREAQASREKQARIILGQAEVEIATLFEEASRSYAGNPTALHLSAMNILMEGLKERCVDAGAELRGGVDGNRWPDGRGSNEAAGAHRSRAETCAWARDRSYLEPGEGYSDRTGVRQSRAGTVPRARPPFIRASPSRNHDPATCGLAPHCPGVSIIMYSRAPLVAQCMPHHRISGSIVQIKHDPHRTVPLSLPDYDEITNIRALPSVT
ncbi:MAG: slipin family protein [Gemmatimonadaceae bacterium]